MILLDSNIIIYLRDPSIGPKIVTQLQTQSLATCNVVVSEVLGFKDLELDDARGFEQLFDTMQNYLFDTAVTQKVIDIRRSVAMQLPDAIIAATALVHGLTLWTHNTEDFERVNGLDIFDPIVSRR